jgi:hypothetical protein
MIVQTQSNIPRLEKEPFMAARFSFQVFAIKKRNNKRLILLPVIIGLVSFYFLLDFFHVQAMAQNEQNHINLENSELANFPVSDLQWNSNLELDNSILAKSVLKFSCSSSGGCFDIPLPEWIYAQQGNGDFSQANNCGPASVVMAIRFATGQYASLRPEDVRPFGNMGAKKNTSLSQLTLALDHYIGKSNYRLVSDFTDLENAVTVRHHIVIALVRMSAINTTSSDFTIENILGPKRCPIQGHCVGQINPSGFPGAFSYTIWNQQRPDITESGRFNTYLGNHWLVVKGEISAFGTRMITFDPDVFGGYSANNMYWYEDRTPKGRGRSYEASTFRNGFEQTNSQGIEIMGSAGSLLADPNLQSNDSGVIDEMIAQGTQQIDNTTLISDVNYPSGSLVAPGQSIVKSWKVKNSGQTDIAYEYKMVQVGGPELITYGPMKLGFSFLEGDEATVSVQILVPLELGTYTTFWQFEDPNGGKFGDLLPLVFTVTNNQERYTDSGSFVSDISLPDGTVVNPGQSLTKTWRMKNTGTSTWGSGYQLAFVSGEQMGAPSAVNVPSTAPNANADISINITAPSAAGDHSGFWRLRNSQGTYFGPQIWVKVKTQVASGGSGSSHITLFDVSPASPSTATSVHLVGRISSFPEFRSMRFVAGGTSFEMTNYKLVGNQYEISADWNTASLTRGNYSITLEVDTKGGTSWANPERQVKTYTLTGAPAPVNHAPNRPNLTSPYDWYVYYSGNTGNLCAHSNGDPDGDAIAGYYFEIFDSAQSWNSGWTGSNCTTTSALGPYTFQWHVKVRDGSGAESGWSENWHFTLVNPSLSISELYFQPQDANSEQVKIRTCTTGMGGIGITMRVSVNDANDGSASGQWHIIKEQGSPCFNDVDAPMWNTLDFGDGPHLVRSEAHGLNTGWDGVAVREEVYTLPHRRPSGPRPLAPSSYENNGTWWKNRTITFQWQVALRTESQILRVSTNSDIWGDPSPLLNVQLNNTASQYSYTFSQDYAKLYWGVKATNSVGSADSGGGIWFGIDNVKPGCAVTSPTTSYDNIFQVNWSGTDNAAGIQSYVIYYLDYENQQQVIWQSALPSKTYDLFSGLPGHQYAFYCLSTDKAGNSSNAPAYFDSWTRIDTNARPVAPWWNDGYAYKRSVTVLNNMPASNLPNGYPVKLRFDGTTSPTATEIYNASLSNPKCDDLRILYNDTTELNRVVTSCSTGAIELWFRNQTDLGGGANSTAYQLYYGNSSPGTPPANQGQVFYPSVDANTVGMWYLDGNGNDSSSFGNNGNWNNGTWVTGKFGQALQMPDTLISEGGVKVTGTESLRVYSFSIEAFIKRARADSACGNTVVSQGQSNNQNERFNFYIGGNSLGLQVWNSGDKNSGWLGDWVDTAWHHIAATFDYPSRTYQFYLDGNLRNSGTMDQWEFMPGNPTVTIGSMFNSVGGQSGPFCGTIDGVRLSNVVRPSFDYGRFVSITNEPLAQAGALQTPPVTGTRSLEVLGVNTYPSPLGGIVVEAIVRNNGTLPTGNGFVTDLYLNHIPTIQGDRAGSVKFWVNDPIPAGATVTLTTVITDLSQLTTSSLGPAQQGSLSEVGINHPLQAVSLAPGTETNATLYLQVDTTGAVMDGATSTSIYSTGTQVCFATPDAFENDDTAITARSISVGSPQTRNFDIMSDQDWVKFSAVGGRTYTLSTSDLSTSADTFLALYHRDHATLLASNDDYGGTLASQITWTAPSTGIYYAVIRHWNPSVEGCGTRYTFSVIENNQNIFLPLITR